MLAVLGGHLATFGRLLDRQADAAALQVEVDDLHPQLLAGRDDLLGEVDVVRRHLGDVHQAFDALADLHEGAERHELGDPAVDQLADAVGGGELLPGSCWVALSDRLMRSRSRSTSSTCTSTSSPTLHDRRRMVDVLPRQLGHVDEAVHAAEVDEGTEVDDRRHDALPHLARLEVGEELLALFLLRLLQPGAAREHDVVAVLVELDDLGFEVRPT